jgi:hypothetical protein
LNCYHNLKKPLNLHAWTTSNLSFSLSRYNKVSWTVFTLWNISLNKSLSIKVSSANSYSDRYYYGCLNTYIFFKKIINYSFFTIKI